REVVAGLVERRLAAVHVQRSRRDGVGVELSRRGDARTDGVDVRAGRDPTAMDDRLARAGGGGDDVGAANGFFDGVDYANVRAGERLGLRARPAADPHLLDVAHVRNGQKVR